jgi:uncharacterized protein (DUF4415 family)
MIIPKIERKARPLIYPFDKIKVNEPFAFDNLNEQQKKNIGTAARQYAARHKQKIAIRINGDSLTIYRTK